MKPAEKIAIVLALIGVAVVLVLLRHGPPMVVIWNLWPYPVAVVAAIRMESKISALCGVAAMLSVDAWLGIETLLGTSSSLLLGVSLLATLKFFTMFPAGLLLGTMIEKKRSSVARRRQ